MARQPSGPERRFAALAAQLGLRDLEPNDGTPDARCIDLSEDQRGTSILRDGKLFSDYPLGSSKAPKNYKLIRPDFRLQADFVEIKGNLAGRAWASLSRDALNDHIRLALLRMRAKCVPDARRSYDALDALQQRIVEAGLGGRGPAAFKGRHYLNWEALTAAVAAPDDNLAETTLAFGDRVLPVKVVVGLERWERGRLFVVDEKIMRQWDMITQ